MKRKSNNAMVPYNFNIDVKKKTGTGVHIELVGNFDGASALELIFFMNKCFSKNKKVFINTDFLCSIESFGINVFRYNIGFLIKYRNRFEFIGESAAVFVECWPRHNSFDHNIKTRIKTLPFQYNN
jgi:hypothetical protein